jgi:hypothetical protein
MGNEYARAEALSGLAPHLPETLLSQALAAALAIGHEYARAEALSRLAPHLTSINLSFWYEILQILSQHGRGNLLVDIPNLSSTIIYLGGIQALVATAWAIQDVCRQWK